MKIPTISSENQTHSQSPLSSLEARSPHFPQVSDNHKSHLPPPLALKFVDEVSIKSPFPPTLARGPPPPLREANDKCIRFHWAKHRANNIFVSEIVSIAEGNIEKIVCTIMGSTFLKKPNLDVALLNNGELRCVLPPCKQGKFWARFLYSHVCLYVDILGLNPFYAHCL